MLGLDRRVVLLLRDLVALEQRCQAFEVACRPRVLRLRLPQSRLGAAQPRLGGQERLLRRAHAGPRVVDHRARAQERALGGGRRHRHAGRRGAGAGDRLVEIGAAAVARDLEVATIDLEQNVAGVDRLMVLDVNGDHHARHPRRDRMDRGTDARVVGRFATGEHPPAHRDEDREQNGERHHQAPARPQRAGHASSGRGSRWRGRRSWIGHLSSLPRPVQARPPRFRRAPAPGAAARPSTGTGSR